jgi:hypothetical protein
VPLLETVDSRTRWVIVRTLRKTEQYIAPVGGDYTYDPSLYQRYLVGREATPPPHLVRYLYGNPWAALTLFARLYLGEDEADRRRVILWGDHLVRTSMWKSYQGLLPKDVADPAAVKALDELSRDKAWWVRMYAARVLRDRPPFR